MASRRYNRHKLDAFIVRVQDFIARRRLLRPGSRVVAAVSGGPDSMALLDSLNRLGYSLVVAHLDHGMRPGSWDEAEQVLRQAAQWGIPAIAERCDVPGMAAPRENLEAAARRLRYGFLARVARETSSVAVVTGHTADDQIETFLLHLLRGSGTQGLRGMLPEQPLSAVVPPGAAGDIRLVRPLLGVWRQETFDYCRRMDTLLLEDPSNSDQSLLRNRVRHELIPILETYNPQVRAALYRAAHATAEAHQAISREVDLALSKASIETPDGFLLWLEPLAEKPDAVRKEVLRRAVGVCGGDNERAEEVEQLERLCRLSRPGHLRLGGGVEVWRARDRLFVVRPEVTSWAGFPQFLRGKPVEITPERCLRLGGGWTLACERTATRTRLPARQRVALGPHVAWMQSGARSELPTLRAWQEGDRMRLFGSGGTAKVADLLSRAQVPPPARRAWPVVLDRGEVAWIPGVMRGELCRIPDSARSLLRIELTWPRLAAVWLAREADPGD